MKFTSTAACVVPEDLEIAVNAAVLLQRPLLVKGEPGIGKTELARQLAACLQMPLMKWHLKSTTRAQRRLDEYDAVSRQRDSQLGAEKVRVHESANSLRQGKLWQAFAAPERVMLRFDAVDKALGRAGPAETAAGQESGAQKSASRSEILAAETAWGAVVERTGWALFERLAFLARGQR